MMEGSGAEAYGSMAGGAEKSEHSQLMATAVAGAAMDAAKKEATKLKNMVLHMREGPVSIKILSYIAAFLLITSGFFSFCGSFFTLHLVNAVTHVYTFVFGWVILIIEARSSLLPKKIVANIHKYCGFTTVVWGRGAFLIYVGTLSLAEWGFPNIAIGLYLICVGAGMIYWGKEAYKNLDALHGEMKNPSVVKEIFSKYDHNHDGVLDASELGNLLESLGAVMRPTEVEAAVIIMDENNDGKISFEEFQAWWTRSSTEMV